MIRVSDHPKQSLRENEDLSVEGQDNLSFCSISNVAEWESLADEWNQLNAESWQPSVFRSYEWAVAWWRHFLNAAPDRLQIYTVRTSANRLVGIFPFYRKSSSPEPGRSAGDHVQRIAAREWRLIGDLGTSEEGLTEEPTAVLAGGHEDTVLTAITKRLEQERRWDYYRFEVQLPQPNFTRTWNIQANAKGLHLQTWKQLQGSQLVTLPASWEAYRKSLSKSMRDNTSYYPRRLDKAAYSWQVRFCTEPDEVRQMVPCLIDLHRQRANQADGIKGHDSHIASERHERFLEDHLSFLAQRNQAYIALLEIDGEPIAAQAFLQYDRILTFYYSGFRPAWHPYSPVFLLACAALRKAIADNLRGANFLQNSELWKERWGASMIGVGVRNRTTRFSPGSLLRILIDQVRR